MSEYLRSWCDAQGRTPEPHEQAQIAQQQACAVLQHTSGTVIADTTPLAEDQVAEKPKAKRAKTEKADNKVLETLRLVTA